MMSGQKRDEDFLDAITQSVVRVLGKKDIKVAMEMQLKRDLDLTSLDVVDVSFELEQITGLQVRLADIYLEQETKGLRNCHDIQIRDIARHLRQLSEKK